MAVLSKGHTFADGDDVTSTKANNLVDQATFVSGASGTTDDSSLEVNGSGRLQIKSSGVTTGKIGASAVTTAKLANSTATTDGVTFPKMRYLSDMTVIGNVSGGETTPAEVTILDEDAMGSDSATSLATQQSIKAYADSYAVKYSGATVFTGSMPTSWTDLDLSGTVGGNRSLVQLLVEVDVRVDAVKFRPKDAPSKAVGFPVLPSGGGSGISAAAIENGYMAYLMVTTDSSGVIQWRANVAGSGATTVKVITHQKVQ